MEHFVMLVLEEPKNYELIKQYEQQWLWRKQHQQQ